MSYFGLLARRFAPWTIVSVLLLALSRLALADASTANLTVAVSDSTGALLAGAVTVLRNTETNQEQRFTTQRTGNATFTFLRPGHYSLTVSKKDFTSVQIDNLLLNVGDEKVFRLTLKVGSAAQSVTVDGSELTINTTNGSVSTVVDRQFVSNMPLNGRSFQDLISMTPGVSTQSPQSSLQKPGGSGDFSINGQRTESNYYIVDGVSANTSSGPGLGGNSTANGGLLAAGTALGTTQTLLSVDALEEFRVNTSTYSAEYGRSPGGQISLLSRSGTNNLHGSAFEYLRNGWFDANNWFNDRLGQKKLELHQNDFGGTVGGPFRLPLFYHGAANTFFFASYEGLRLSQPVAASIQYVPDAYMREQAPPIIQAFLNAFPKQTPNGIDYGTEQSPGVAQFLQGYSVPGAIDSTSFRLDHSFSSQLSSFFRFSYNPSSIESRALSSLTSAQVRSTSYTFGSTYQLKSNLTDEFRIGYAQSRSRTDTILDDFAGAVPISLESSLHLTASDYANPRVAILLPGTAVTQIQTDKAENTANQWNITNTVALLHDAHQIKVGIDYRRIENGATNPSPVSLVEYLSAQQLLTNSSPFAQIGKYLNADQIYNQFAAFAQDDWKVSPRVSLSLGIRWEVAPPPHSGNETQPSVATGNLSNPASLSLATPGASLWKMPWFNFAPRVGLAWQIHNASGRETIFRAGAGVFFDTNNEVASGAFNGVGYSSLKSYSGNVPMPFTTPQNDFSVGLTPPYSLVMYFPTHLQLPYTLQWSAAVEQGLGRAQTLSLTYVASAGRRLLQTQELVPATPTFSSLYYVPGAGVTSNYDALQAKFQRQLVGGVSALVSYTWSHSLDSGSTSSSLPLSYGDSDFDLRHNFQTGLTWELPSSRSTGLRHILADGWGLDGRVLARTAFPITLRGNYISNPISGSVYYTNVNLVANQPLYLYGQQYPGGRAVNRAAFSLPMGSNPGTAPRNFVRGFGANQVNVAMRRRIKLSENVGLQLRGEAFNLLNRPVFGYIDPTLTDVTFGQATQTLNQSLATVASQYQQGGPRSLQFALKLIF